MCDSMFPYGNSAPEKSELWGGFGVLNHVPEGSLQQSRKDSEKESEQSRSHYDKSALGKGTPVRRDGRIDDLNDRAFFGFVEFGQLELAGEDVEDGLVVLYIPQPANIVHA